LVIVATDCMALDISGILTATGSGQSLRLCRAGVRLAYVFISYERSDEATARTAADALGPGHARYFADGLADQIVTTLGMLAAPSAPTAANTSARPGWHS